MFLGKKNAIVVVKDKRELEKRTYLLFKDKNIRCNIINSAKMVLTKNKGALSRTMDIVVPLVEKCVQGN